MLKGKSEGEVRERNWVVDVIKMHCVCFIKFSKIYEEN